MSSLADSMLVTPTSDPSIFTTTLSTDFRTGPHIYGPFIASKMCSAAKAYSNTISTSSKHTDVVSAQLNFLQPMNPGEARLQVKLTKTGGLSTLLHVEIASADAQNPSQRSASPLPGAVGYITIGRLRAQSKTAKPNVNFTSAQRKDGKSTQTRTLNPTPQPVDLAQLAQDKDSQWQLLAAPPHAEWRTAMSHVHMYVPKNADMGSEGDAKDHWVRSKNKKGGKLLTQEVLPYIMGTAPIAGDAVLNREMVKKEPSDMVEAEDTQKPGALTMKHYNLDFRKRLPENGAEWLFVRRSSKLVQAGKLDLEWVVVDEEGEVVVLGNMMLWVLPNSKVAQGVAKL